jgi:two-component system response regulator MprA
VEDSQPYSQGLPLCAMRRTVLIVDDEPSVTHTFERMLRFAGYNVLTAPDAESGLCTMASARPDAVLLDLRMPFVDGLEFLRRVRAQEQDRHTPIAIITGDYFVEEAVSRELRELGASVHLKPLWFENLIDIMQRLLGVTP